MAERLRKLVPPPGDARDVVTEILVVVAHEGDEAVLEYTRELDTGGLPPRPLVVPPEELDEAIVRLPLEAVAGLQVAIANVAAVAQVGVGEDVSVRLPQGHTVTVRELPVDAAAVYVPGGRAPYPSTAVMGVVTARAAGVQDVVVCSPPGRDGQIDPLILGTCRLLGVERVYRMGGAQAVAALAYGTETVERVDVIVGPGNVYVQEAKRKLSDVVGIDSFAGPSDLLVVLGEDADPRLAALDVLAQAEHGAGSFVAALSPSAGALDALAAEVERLVAGAGATATERPAVEAPRCVLVQSADTRAAVEIVNEYAPEHLQLLGAEPEALAPLVRRAGCVFVGAAAGTAFGDYVAGSNHILPTAGAARFASGLSPRHFRRRQAEVRLGAVGGPAARKLAAAGAPIARAEGFEWHARSMEARAEEPPAGEPPAVCPHLGRPLSRRPSSPERPRVAPSAKLSGDGRRPAHATLERRTGETDVTLTLALDGTGAGTRATGVGFLDHMLDLLARHGRLDLDVRVTGDLQTGAHHTVEDTAIVLGQALDAALGDRAGIVRYGSARGADGRGARELRHRHLRAPIHAVRGRPAAGLDGGLRARAHRGVLPRGGHRREAHAAPAGAGGHQRAPPDRGRLQGVRAGAARRGRARPLRDGGAEHEGDADWMSGLSAGSGPSLARTQGAWCAGRHTSDRGRSEAPEMTPRIAVVDYGMGNRRSVEKALERVGARAFVSRDHAELRAADGLLLPGVGAFPAAMAVIRELGLDRLLRELAAAGTPLFGSCMGMQLLFERSEEHGGAKGLGLLQGEVRTLETGDLKLPHIGWSEVAWRRPLPAARGPAGPDVPLPRALLRGAPRRPRGGARHGASTGSSSPRWSAPATCTGRSRTWRSPRPTACACWATSWASAPPRRLRGYRPSPPGCVPRRDPLPRDRHPWWQRGTPGQGRLRREEGLRPGPALCRAGVRGGRRPLPARGRSRRRQERHAGQPGAPATDRRRARLARAVRRRAALRRRHRRGL